MSSNEKMFNKVLVTACKSKKEEVGGQVEGDQRAEEEGSCVVFLWEIKPVLADVTPPPPSLCCLSNYMGVG